MNSIPSDALVRFYPAEDAHLHGSDGNDPPMAVYTTNELDGPHLIAVTRQAALPDLAGGWYDFTGDGLVTANDAWACGNYQPGLGFWWTNPADRFDVTADSCIYSPAVTLCVLLGQCLSGDRSCRGSCGTIDCLAAGPRVKLEGRRQFPSSL